MGTPCPSPRTLEKGVAKRQGDLKRPRSNQALFSCVRPAEKDQALIKEARRIAGKPAFGCDVRTVVSLPPLLKAVVAAALPN